MKNKENLKKKVIFRSTHRGTKEMDLLLGDFVKKYIHFFDIKELEDLNKILSLDDEILYKWYMNKKSAHNIAKTKVSLMLKNFKI